MTSPRLKIRHRYDHWIPKVLHVAAITLYPWVLYASKTPPRTMLAHEWIHVEQVRRVGWLRFYVQYLAEYAYLLIKHRDHFRAYRNISFEMEAYEKENDPRFWPEAVSNNHIP